jgi:hypothetical protein
LNLVFIDHLTVVTNTQQVSVPSHTISLLSVLEVLKIKISLIFGYSLYIINPPPGEDVALIFFSMALRAHSGLWPLIQFLNNFFSQTVVLLGRAISPSQSLYLITGQHKQNKRLHTKHQCLEWDSNPRSQCPSERREFMP